MKKYIKLKYYKIKKIIRFLIAIAKMHYANYRKREYIVGVAIISKGKVFELDFPNRHHHCVHKAYIENYHKQVIATSQGFITNTGRYVERKEALVIAKTAKQLQPFTYHHPTELFSESLW